MAIRYVSDSTANGYAVGVDSGTAATKAAPWLTANHALDNASDGDTIIFNDGTYTYSNGNGRKIFTHESIEIAGETEYNTTLVMSGTEAQGIRVNGSDTETRTLTLGKINIESSSGGAKTELVYFSGTTSIHMMMTLNTQAKFTNIESVDASSVIRLAAKHATLNVTGGGAYGEHSGTSCNGVIYASALENTSAVNITSFDLGVSAKWTSSRGPINLKWAEACPDSTCLISGVKGSATDTSTTSGTSYAIVIYNGPEGTDITNNNNLVYGCADAARFGCLFNIQSLAAESLSCNNSFIRNNTDCVIDAENGFLALFGGEGTDHNTSNGTISGNTLAGIVGKSGNVHGICHIGCLGGIRENNTVSLANIGSLTKRGTAISRNNVYRDLQGTTEAFLYAKGAEAGTVFSNETCHIYSGFSGFVELAIEDPTDGQDSDSVTFESTKIFCDTSAAIESCNLSKFGSASDTSTAFSSNMLITVADWTIPANDDLFISGATSYPTVASWNASDFAEGCSYAKKQYGLIRPLISRNLISRSLITRSLISR